MFNKEFSIDHTVTYSQIETLLLADNYYYLSQLLELDSEFSEWFINNHYLTTSYEVISEYEDEVTGEMKDIYGEVTVYKSSNAWRFMSPTDDKFFQTYALEDEDGNFTGYLQDSKGRYRIPNI